jgi:transcriptional regulator with XRE-family HTH domain
MAVSRNHEAPMSAAIARAVANAGRKKRELAEYLGVDQSTVTHMVSDREPSYETVTAIESWLRKPRGWLFIQAGYVDMPNCVEDMILLDRRLTEGVAALAHNSYLFSLKMAEGEMGVPTNREPAATTRRLKSATSA